MGQITVHLLEGFDGDRVVLTVDGEMLASRDDVTTSPLVGSASSLEAAVPDGTSAVTIDVPTREVTTTRELEVRGDAHLLVSVEGGALSCTVTDRAPGFM